MAAKYYKAHFFRTIFLNFYVSLAISRKTSPNFKQFYTQEYGFSDSGRK